LETRSVSLDVPVVSLSPEPDGELSEPHAARNAGPRMAAAAAAAPPPMKRLRLVRLFVSRDIRRGSMLLGAMAAVPFGCGRGRGGVVVGGRAQA
jgi:hypothetical protein